MRILGWLQRLLTNAAISKDERGTVLIYVVLAMTVMLGLAGVVVDLGSETVLYKRAQFATDSAALAAAQSVASGGTETTATSLASTIASQNVGAIVTIAPTYLDSSGASTLNPSSVV